MNEPPVYPTPEAPPPRRPFPRFWQAFLLCLLFLAVSMVTSIILFAMVAVGAAVTGGNPMMPPAAVIQVALTGMANLVAFAVAFSVAGLWAWEDPLRLAPFRRVRPVLFVPMAVAMVGLHLLLSDLDNLMRMLLPMPEFFEDLFEQIAQGTWANLFTVVLVAPVTEELLFRGVIFNGFLRNYRAVTAVLLSALLFGFVHLNPWQFVSAFLLGIVLAWWFMRTRSMWPCMFGHATMNGLALAGGFIPVAIPGYNDFTQTAFQPWWLDTAGFLLALAGLAWLKVAFKETDTGTVTLFR